MTELVGKKFEGYYKWNGCAMGNDGCLYSMPCHASHILRIDPAATNDDSTTTTLVGPDFGSADVGYANRNKFWGCINDHNGFIYSFPVVRKEIIRFNPITQEHKRVKVRGSYNSAVFGLDGMLYFFPSYLGDNRILRYDPISDSMTSVGGILQYRGWRSPVLARDGCLYGIPVNATRVLKFDPSDGSMTFIGDDLGDATSKWKGSVLGEDGYTIYGIPYHHNMILKIDVANQSTSLIGGQENVIEGVYVSGVVGYDKSIYLIPRNAKFVLRFNPITEVISTVGESLGDEEFKYTEGMLAPNGYIYAAPENAKQVLRIRSWDNWLYLKPRLLTEQGRAARRLIQPDYRELNIVQYFIIHSNDDIFRTVIEML